MAQAFLNVVSFLKESNFQLPHRDFAFDSTSESSESQQEYSSYRPSDFIYDGSSITCNEFNISYFWICRKLNLSKNKRNILLEYIKYNFPATNRVPKNYNSLCRSLNLQDDKVEKLVLCSVCYSKLKNRKQLNCEKCEKLKKKPCEQSKRKIVDAIVFDYKNQLSNVFGSKWNEIVDYKERKIHSRFKFIDYS
jgi:hypothetical protein